MPFADDARWHRRLIVAGNKKAEASLGFEYAEAVMTHGKMPGIRKPCRGFEEPAVQRKEEFGGNAEAPGAGHGDIFRRADFSGGQFGWQIHMHEPVGGRRSNTHV